MAEQSKGTGALIFIGAPLIVLATLFLLIVLVFTGGGAAASCAAAANAIDPEKVPIEPVAGFQGDQLKNAAYIMNAASALGLDRKAQVIGVMTAIGESTLVNLDYGDEGNGVTNPDGTPTCSVGLFQQQWCLGTWGTREQAMDPTYAATSFFQRLVGVADWQNLEPTLAIHKVQGNADPFYYAPLFEPADAIVTALAGGPTGIGCASGSVVLPLSPGFNMTDDFGPRGAPTGGASSWHPADDLQHWPGNCNDPIYSIDNGTVALVEGYQVSIKSPAGYTVSYLHMDLADVTVNVGDAVTAGQQIALTGNEGPSTGCHLDIRINVDGNTDPQVATLPTSETLGAPVAGFIDPEKFFALFGVELCPTDSCTRNY